MDKEEHVVKKRRVLVYRYLLMVLLTVLPLSSIFAQTTLKEVVKRVQPSTVMLIIYSYNGDTASLGSGFFISKNRIITNRHVFTGGFEAKAKLPNGYEYEVLKVVAEDKEHDLICVEIKKPKYHITPLRIDPKLPEVGDHVVAIGSPLGLEATVSEGIVSAVRKLPQDGEIIQITAPVSSGSSGGPLVNMKGKVIGEAHYLLGRVYLELGEMDRVFTEYRILKSLDDPLSDLYADSLVIRLIKLKHE